MNVKECTITAVQEGRRKDADDTQKLTIRRDGHVLTVTGAPPERCRINPGILEVMRRSTLTADMTWTWEQLRAWAAEFGLFVDPLDYPDNGPSRERSRSNGTVLRALGLSK